MNFPHILIKYIENKCANFSFIALLPYLYHACEYGKGPRAMNLVFWRHHKRNVNVISFCHSYSFSFSLFWWTYSSWPAILFPCTILHKIPSKDLRILQVACWLLLNSLNSQLEQLSAKSIGVKGDSIHQHNKHDTHNTH